MVQRWTCRETANMYNNWMQWIVHRWGLIYMHMNDRASNLSGWACLVSWRNWWRHNDQQTHKQNAPPNHLHWECIILYNNYVPARQNDANKSKWVNSLKLQCLLWVVHLFFQNVFVLLKKKTSSKKFQTISQKSKQKGLRKNSFDSFTVLLKFGRCVFSSRDRSLLWRRNALQDDLNSHSSWNPIRNYCYWRRACC